MSGQAWPFGDCGLRWDAPLLLENGRFTLVRQTCVMPRGHDGPCRSATKTIRQPGDNLLRPRDSENP